MFGKKASRSNIDGAIAKSANFEVTIADITRRSERRAWWVAGSAVAMALILAGGYFIMLPLKEKVPYLVMADAYTGTSTVARLTDDAVNQHISAHEAINRSNVAHFVLARESYDVAMMNLHDWTTVLTMAAPDVAAAYQNLYAATYPDSPYKLYGKDRAIRVKILSTVLIGGSNGQPYKGATVRFQRSLYNKQTGATQPLDSKIATLAFTYKPNLKMDEKYRIENPLGFQVTSYRVDNDYATATPEETPEAPATAQSADANGDGHEDPSAQQTPLSAQPPVSEHGAQASASSAAPATGNNAQGEGRR